MSAYLTMRETTAQLWARIVDRTFAFFFIKMRASVCPGFSRMIWRVVKGNKHCGNRLNVFCVAMICQSFALLSKPFEFGERNIQSECFAAIAVASVCNFTHCCFSYSRFTSTLTPLQVTESIQLFPGNCKLRITSGEQSIRQIESWSYRTFILSVTLTIDR